METVGAPGVSPLGSSRWRDARRRLPSRGSRGSRVPPCCGALRREDSPRPLSGRFAGRSLPETAPAARCSWCPHRAPGLGEAPRARQGLGSLAPPVRAVDAETGGAPTVPRSPAADLPRSQPPGVSCALAAVAPRRVACRRMPTVGCCLDIAEAILWTTPRPIAGRKDAAGLRAPSRCVRPLLGWHAAFTTDRRARHSSGGTGTDLYAPTGAHPPMS
jgi:hypothetical protein